jgi:glutaredoxin
MKSRSTLAPHPAAHAVSLTCAPGARRKALRATATALTLSALTALALMATAMPAHALYKVVRPDGTVTYTDRPPQQETPSKAGQSGTKITTVAASSSANIDPSSLPYEVRIAAQKSPVVLYTAENCQPCVQGRALLMQRGIPFQERTAKSGEDLAAWKEVTGGTQAPVLTVGGQKLSGFQNGAWTAALDGAGYPSASKLPSSFKQADASSIAPERKLTAATKPEAAAPVQATQAAPSAPGGIRF